MDAFGYVGQTLDGRYRVDAVVGEGGFGVVYRAFHLGFAAPVALKVLRAVGRNEREKHLFAEAFRAEARHLLELSGLHTAFVRALDAGVFRPAERPPTPYIALEWLEGEGLDRDLARRRAAGARGRSLSEALALCEPVASALAIAHGRGVVHRDVKPGNIYLARTAAGPQVKLLDFGLAKVMTVSGTTALHFTERELCALTPEYAAPEQWHPKYGATGPWTDVYALALVVVELLVDRPALAGRGETELQAATLDPVRPAPRNLGADVPEAIDRVLARALRIDVLERYPNVGAFWSELSQTARAAWVAPHPAGVRVASGAAPVTSSGVAAPTLAAAGLVLPRTPAAAAPSAAAIGARAPASVTATAGPAGHAPLPRGPVAKGSRTGVAIGGAAAATLLVTIVIAAKCAGSSETGDGGTPAATGAAASATGDPSARPWGPPARTPPSAVATPAPSPTPRSSASADPPPRPGGGGGPVSGACPGDMVHVPAGTFRMGSDDLFADEKPVRAITLAAFCIDRTEVTVAAYAACTTCGPLPTTPSDSADPLWSALCNTSGGRADRQNHPMNCLDWNQAATFCASVGKALPSEAQWEYAARGSDDRPFPWGAAAPAATLLNARGSEFDGLARAMHFDASRLYAESDGFPETSPVGSFASDRSPFGVLDMGGNVGEWVASPRCSYASQGCDAPQRTYRGGDFLASHSNFVRTAFRHPAVEASTRANTIGFRCAKSP